jgi:DNA ligase (NAD+)
MRVPNTGEVVATSIRDWFLHPDNIALVGALQRHGLNFGEADRDGTESNRLRGTSWVITGTLGEPREVFEELIRRNGGRVTGNVSKKTDYLLVGGEAGSKLEKARQLGVKIVDERKFEKRKATVRQ